MAVALAYKSSDERTALSAMLLLSHEEQRRSESAAAAEILLMLHNENNLAGDQTRKLGVAKMNKPDGTGKKASIEDISIDPIVSKLQQMIEEGVLDAESTLGKYRKGKLSDRALQQLLNSIELRDGGATMATDPSNTSSRTLSDASEETISDKSTISSEKIVSNQKAVSKMEALSKRQAANNKRARTNRKASSGDRGISTDETVPHNTLAPQVSQLQHTRPEPEGLALSQSLTSAMTTTSRRNNSAIIPAAQRLLDGVRLRLLKSRLSALRHSCIQGIENY